MGLVISGEQTRYVAKILFVAGAYFATAKLGLQLAFEHESITAVWPPTGIALAAVVVWGYRMWPGVALGAALANTFTGDVPAITVLGITLGNTLEALAGAALLRWAGFQPSLARVRDVLSLAVLAGAVSTTVSATIGVTSLWIGDQIATAGDLPSAWRVWWLGDMGGALLVAPFLLVLAAGARLPREPARLVEAGAVLAVLVGISVLVFSQDVPYTYLIFPPLIWAALRFRQLGASFASLVVATVAVVFTENDAGPFVRGSQDAALLLAQTFMGVAGATSLLLAAILSERRRAEELLQRAHDQLEQTVADRTAQLVRSNQELELQGLIARNLAEGICLVRAADSTIVYANPEFERMLGYDAGELNGMHVAAINYDDGGLPGTEATRRITALLERAGEATYEVRNRRKDGTPVWCRAHTSSFEHPEHGKVWVAVHEDVTERKRADVLERSFVPEHLPEMPNVQLASRFIPGGAGVEVGGDWYDVFEVRDGNIGLVIGDVAGRGVPAAAVMSQLRNGLRAYALDRHPPGEALDRLNQLAFTLGRGVMATLIYLVFDPASGSVRFATAGHLPPLVVRADGSTTYLEEGRSLPVGALPEAAYPEAEHRLEPDAALLLYTDGLVEERRVPIDAGLHRLAAAAGGSHHDLDALCDRILATMEPSGDDDVALLALEPVPLVPEGLRLELPAEPMELAPLRRTLRLWLAACDATDQESHDIVLACNEAAANAIEHAYGPGDGTLHMNASLRDGKISITIRDHGRWREPRGDNRGRGLPLMKATMDAVSVVKGDPTGTEVRMIRTLGGRAANGDPA